MVVPDTENREKEKISGGCYVLKWEMTGWSTQPDHPVQLGMSSVKTAILFRVFWRKYARNEPKYKQYGYTRNAACYKTTTVLVSSVNGCNRLIRHTSFDPRRSYRSLLRNTGVGHSSE